MNTSKILLVILFAFAATFCKAQSKALLFDQQLIESDTIGCGLRIFQYFQVKGKYPLSSETLAEEANFHLTKNLIEPLQNGYITFRFLVNCDGETKFFTVAQVDKDYQEVTLDTALANAFYSFIKGLKNWKKAADKNNNPICYWNYLTFKIENGKVEQVVP